MIAAVAVTWAISRGGSSGGPSEIVVASAETVAAQAGARETREAASPTPDPRVGTPIPREDLHPVTLMFCEPVRGPDGRSVAVLSPDVQPAYEPGTCQPDVDPSGAVAVLEADGSQGRAAPSYVDAQSAPRDSIVWMPATGTLNGASVVMTGRYLVTDSQVVFSPIGDPLVTFNMTGDGRQVFGSLSERLIGFPISVFLDGEPLHSSAGDIIAPTIQSRIAESGQFTGLSLDDAKRLAALIDYGYAQ